MVKTWPVDPVAKNESCGKKRTERLVKPESPDHHGAGGGVDKG